MQVCRAIGLMSGTSMDGVDVALVETDGEARLSFGPTGFLPYGEAERALLRAAVAEARNLDDRSARPGVLGEAERLVTDHHAEAVEAFLRNNALAPSAVDIIGFHGQTVLHRPERRLTVQIGDGRALARRLGVPVVHDFRAADVAAGAQGAPLVPVFHRALVESARLGGAVAVLNIGGVANLTYIEAGQEPVACDTGPGNALIDDLMLARFGRPLDAHGLAAARGRVNGAILERLLSHPFFELHPPKSLDRNVFNLHAVDELADDDAAATLTAFTAASVARLIPHLPKTPHLLIVCGGGAHNPILLRELVERLPCKIATADAFGWAADAIEAQAFAYLAVRALKGLPITFPSTTGVAKPLSGGVLARPGAADGFCHE